MQVFGGLAPLNIEILTYIPTSSLGVYFTSWSTGILESSRFVTRSTPIACSGENCTSVYLPGGIEDARMRNYGNLNSTLLNSPDLFPVKANPAILVNGAPGYQMDFYSVDSNFTFNTSECGLYGQNRGQGIYLCVGSNKDAYVIGFNDSWNAGLILRLEYLSIVDILEFILCHQSHLD